MPRYTQQVVLLDSTSANSSTYTSSFLAVAEALSMSVSWTTGGAAASTLTIQGSNDQGTLSSIVTVSTMSTIAVQGIYVIEPGVRWLRTIRGSSDSQAVVQISMNV